MIPSLEDLLHHMGDPTLTDNQRAHVANVILPGVQGELEQYLHRHVEKTRVREILEPDDEGFVTFSWTPVWEIVGIWDFEGNTVAIENQITKPTLPALPASQDPEMRTVDFASMGIDDMPYKYYIGVTNPWQSWLHLNPQKFTFLYYDGFNGNLIPGLKQSMLDVAERSVTALWDSSVGLRTGAIESAPDSDAPRKKHWEQDELEKWDRLRRRIIV